jgi:acyl-CoA thioester hydrolase
MSDLIQTHQGIAYPWQCDHMGHMNVMWYVGKVDEATWQLVAHLGLTPSFLRQQQRGMAAVQQEITYRRELRAGDLITIASQVLEIREKVLRFSHDMRNVETDEVAATTTLTGVYLDTQLRTSRPFPPAVLERARALINASTSACGEKLGQRRACRQRSPAAEALLRHRSGDADHSQLMTQDGVYGVSPALCGFR